MKKILMIVLSLIICPVIFLTGCGEQKKIVIGLDDEYAPMGFRDEQENIIGFDIDLAKEVARRMKVEVEFKPIDWNNKEEEITSGNVDMIWNGLDITPERQQYMIYSKPYMDNRQILLVKKGNSQGTHNVDFLKDKKVGTQAGSNSETYINDSVKFKKMFAAFTTYRTITEEFDALNKNEVDVLIIDEVAALYEIKKIPEKFEVIDVTIGPITELGIGFNKKNIELRDKVQATFDDMITDGTAKKISEEWFGVNLIKSRT